ncbi:MAG: translation initiation factor IF-3 [Clostridium sp.]
MEVRNINNKKFIINEDIREKEIRVLSDDGSQLGIMATRDAQAMADEKEMDLVMISPTAKPPVCRIMNLGKYIYEQNKKDKEAKKKQKVTTIKEVRCSLTIEENDIAIKAKNARKFLLDGDKVKITIRFKGREAQLGHLGLKILENFVSKLEDVCVVEKPAKQEGRNMTLMVGPKKA